MREEDLLFQVESCLYHNLNNYARATLPMTFVVQDYTANSNLKNQGPQAKVLSA